jgi:hypothetical protein
MFMVLLLMRDTLQAPAAKYFLFFDVRCLPASVAWVG